MKLFHCDYREKQGSDLTTWCINQSQIDLIYSFLLCIIQIYTYIVYIPENGMSWGGFQADFDESSASFGATGIQSHSGIIQLYIYNQLSTPLT